MKPDTTTLTEFEIIDSKSLAERLRVTPSWVRKQTSARENCLPHLKLGRYVRYLWGSPDLSAWLQRRYQK